MHGHTTLNDSHIQIQMSLKKQDLEIESIFIIM
jgi:hypothetical protein